MRIWLCMLVLAAVAVTGCSSTSTASRGGDEQQIAANVSGDSGDEMVCRRVKKTGTRFTEKICMTRDKYEEQSRTEGAAHAVREWQRRNAQYGSEPAGG